MSQQAEKITRRNLRRAVGDQTLAVVDRHSDLLTFHNRRMDGLAGDVETAANRLDAHQQRIDAMQSSYASFISQRWWQRLRWLVTGQ